MSKKIREIKTDEEIKIFSDPYRMKIINKFYSAKKPMTVKGIADVMGETPAKVHYHVKKLLSIDILELDHVEVINGINAKYYTLTAEDFEVKFPSIAEDSATGKSQLQHVVYQVIERFKEDVSDGIRMVNPEKSGFDGFVTMKYPNLSEEQYEKFQKYITDFMKEHSSIESEDPEYSILVGVVKMQDKSKK